MQLKTCADCCAPKPLDEFGPTNQKLKFGVKSRCRACEREYKRKWVKDNPIRVKETHTDWITVTSNRDKVRAWNTAYAKRMAKEHPERMAVWQRRNLLKRKYGVTIEWFAEKSMQQFGKCAICGGPPGQKGLVVDHCHITNRVRELLCGNCNFALHKLERDIEWVRKAEAYLLRNA